MARNMYDGHSLTGLRQWARELKIAGRSKMGGLELLTACHVANLANIRALEEAVLPAVRVGALLRHKTGGDIIRVTGDVYAWQPNGASYGSRCAPAEYVECDGWGDARRAERAAHQNDSNKRYNHVARHPLWQYEAI